MRKEYYMKLKKKLISFSLTAAMILTMTAVPMTAFADTESAWDAPTTAMAVDDSIAKVGIHAAASTASFFLGGNVVAERKSDYTSIVNAQTPGEKLAAAKEFTRLGAFGSSSNIAPDPYLWNYFYNLAVDAGEATGTPAEDAVYISSVGAPHMADTAIVNELGTSYTLARKPEILMGIAADRQGVTYETLIADMNQGLTEEDPDYYDPILLPYAMNNFSDFVTDMYNLSDAIKASGKNGRYGDTEAIAERYEAFMKGIQFYIISKIEDGTVAKKTVAVIDPSVGKDTDGDGKNDAFQCVSNTVSIGTSTDRPSESIMYISDNIYNTDKVDSEGYASAAAIKDYADVIIQAGHGTMTEAEIRAAFEDAGSALAADTPVYAKDPSDVFTIRANSVENFAGVGIFGGYLYPEIINPIYATMYIYQYFWHLNEDALVTFANANFANASLPEGINRSGSGYDGAEIDAMIADGLQYYADNAADFAGTTLEISDRLAPSLPPARASIEGAVVTAKDQTYTGKALKPAVTVKLGDEKLVSGTDFTVAYSSNKNAGTAKVTVTGTGKYTGTASGTFKIKKAKNPMTLKAVNKSFKVKKVKKKAQTFKAVTMKKNQGSVTYTAKAANKKSKKALSFSKKTAKIKVKKGTKKGTYKMKVTAKAKGNSNYNSATKTVTVTVKVK